MSENAFSEFDLTGKVAVVTGAARGLGLQFALGLAKYGADLVVCDILARELEDAKNEIEKRGHRVLIQHTDITKLGQIDRMVDQTMKTFGHIDILVNNAGVNNPQRAEDVTEEAWDRIMEVNLKGLFFTAQRVGRVMIQQKKGKIINVASTAGFVGVIGRAAYGSSKGGVITLTKLLAIEWAKHQINVNAIAPTFTETPLSRPHLADEDFRKHVLESIPLGRIAQPQDLVGGMIYLASDASNMVTGHVLLVDGGWTAR